MNRSLHETPILDAIVQHVSRERVSLHVPGHHQGRILDDRFSLWLSQASKLDVTELEGLDNLHGATGCILESQQLAASHYGADRTFYSVNGATACVMAAIAACVEATGKKTVMILGPCHLSLWRALVHADAVPVFVSGKWSSESNCVHPVQVSDVEAVLVDRTDVACAFVTSPTYQGQVADVLNLSNLFHTHGIPLVVDEAHGAHLGLHKRFPQHSVALHADIVVQSPHKTLPCLTQAAWIHVQGMAIRSEVVERHLLFLQSTSPSYLLLAAIDSAQAWLRTVGNEVAEQFLTTLAQYTDLPPQNVDPARIWIPMPHLDMSQSFDDTMKAQGVFLEYADSLGALAIFGLGQPPHEFRRFFDTWRAWETDVAPLYPEWRGQHGQVDYELIDALMNGHKMLHMSPREVFYASKDVVSLEDARGKIAASPIVPYPPGVPCIWPGERWEPHHIEHIRVLQERQLQVLGLTSDGRVEVVK